MRVIFLQKVNTRPDVHGFQVLQVLFGPLDHWSPEEKAWCRMEQQLWQLGLLEPLVISGDRIHHVPGFAGHRL